MNIQNIYSIIHKIMLELDETSFHMDMDEDGYQFQIGGDYYISYDGYFTCSCDCPDEKERLENILINHVGKENIV